MTAMIIIQSFFVQKFDGRESEEHPFICGNVFFLVPKLGLGTALYRQAEPGSLFCSQVQLGNELSELKIAAPPAFGSYGLHASLSPSL